MTMTPHPRCARRWEVEAVRDGRLRGHDAESLRRHLETCDLCRAEAADFDALQAGLADLPAPHLDALAARRVRQRVLSDHNTWMLRRGAQSPGARWAALAAASVLVLGALAYGYARRGHVTPRAAFGAPVVAVSAAPGARWQRQAQPHEVRVVVEQGELTLRIRRDDPSDRVAIVLPDGEIDDRGTVLTVAVTDGRTRSVRVAEGRVVLSLRGREALDLAAGQAWQLEAPTPNAQRSDSASAAPVSSTPSAAANSHARRRSAPKSAGADDGAGPPKPATATASEPLDGKAEDEAYLAIVALMREGRLDAARARAKDYLLRFPNGFRRVEVLNVVAQGAQ